MYYKLITIILLILLSGCSHPGLYKISHSEMGSESLLPGRKSIKQSYQIINTSNPFLDKSIAFWTMPEMDGLVSYNAPGWPITIEVVSNDTNIDVGAVKADATATPTLTGCVIKMKRAQVDISNFEMLAHEIGHCIGFAHSPNPQSLMYYKVGYNQTITSDMIRIIKQYRE